MPAQSESSYRELVVSKRDKTEETRGMNSERRPGRRLRGVVVHKLGLAILSGEYAPGDTLPTETASAEELDVSRGAYREAVQVLTAKGLVESRPKAGTQVLPRSSWNLLDPDVIAWAFAGEPDIDFVRNLFGLRAIVEPAAAMLAAERRNHSDLKAMNDALITMRRDALVTETGRMADRHFHGAVLHATRNDALIALTASIGAVVNWTTQFKQRQRTLPRNPIPDHERVYDAIVARDSEAAGEAMRVLVELAMIDTRGAMTG